MNRLLFLPVAALMTLLQSLPLRAVAWLGRRCGDVAWWLDWHHRRLALVNLDIALGATLARAPRERIARQSFRRLGESLLCAVKTSAMERGEMEGHLQVVGLNKLKPWIERTEVPGVVIALGHFGNPTLYDFAAQDLPWMQIAAVDRPVTGWMKSRIWARLRRQSRCRFFQEQPDPRGLRAALRSGNLILGLMGDASPGPDGLAIPLFGHPAATSVAPALFALRHRMPLHAAVCFRTGPGRWRVEVSDEIPTRLHGRRRALEDILTDLNSHWEISIRRDPENWLWTQARWEHAGRTRRRRPLVPAS